MGFKLLVPKLSFIKNKSYWSGCFRSDPVEISEKDYELLKSKLAKLA